MSTPMTAAYRGLFSRWLCAGLLLTWTALAQAVVIDFESLANGAAVGAAYPGVTFSNATVLVAGQSLNETEFPPRSGSAGAFDDSGPMLLSFATPIDFFEGFVNYSQSLVITAFDSSNAVLATATTLFGSNLALSGDVGSQVNEMLRLTVGGIQKIQITGDAAGGSFVIDDVTFRPAGNTVPEPASLLLCGAAFAAAASARRWGKRRRK